jgi:phosphatidylglycerol:prolipoprotein diacylglycerol transferase
VNQLPSPAFSLFASITIDINPVLVSIGHLHLRWYGIAVGLAIAVALLVARSEARRRSLDANVVLPVAMWAVVGGFVGARLLFVLDHWSTYAADPLRSFAVQEGGLAIQGALIGGFVSAFLYARSARLPVLTLADLAAPAVVLGQAVGRLGCLVTGDALGAPTSLPWGVVYVNPAAMAPQLGVALQPVFAYEALLDLAVFALLWRVRTRVQQPGRLFALYLGLYAAGKFGLTFFRQERVWAWGLQEAQFVAMVLVIGAGAFWLLGVLRGTRAATATASAGSPG